MGCLLVVDELQVDVEVGVFEECDYGLQVVVVFGLYVQFVVLDLVFDIFGVFVVDDFVDFFCVFGGDVIFEC